MPRVHSKTKSTRGKEYTCGRCARKIEPGESYFSWSFRYGGDHRRCKEHPPRASELTQSKLSEVYAAQEAVEDALARDFDHDEITSAVEEAAEAIRAVAEEYREAAEAMGEAGYENEERADEVEAAADEYESLYIDEPDDPEDPTAVRMWREEVRNEVGAVEVTV